jgi:hypothetical protein
LKKVCFFLQEIARKESQGYIDHAQSKRKRTLMEMHKKATQRVKHEEKKAQKESSLSHAMNSALAAPAASAGAPSSSVPVVRPPVAFDFGAVMKAPDPSGVFRSAPPPQKEQMPEGYSDYQQSIYRLKKLEQEEERERNFKELLDVQLRAQEQARQEVARVPEAVP